MGIPEMILVNRVQCGHNVWFCESPSYLFDGDVVKVWIPGYDLCYVGIVIGDYIRIDRKNAEIAAGVYCQRGLGEVRGKYVYEEFRG